MIAYLQKTSLIDYPNLISSVVYFAGCNLRCPFCFNKNLWDLAEMPIEIIDNTYKYLKENRKMIDAVVLTGGEPTVTPQLFNFAAWLKEHNYLIKLNTNGIEFNRIRYLIENKLLDMVTISIKTSLNKYSRVDYSDNVLPNLYNTFMYLKNTSYEVNIVLDSMMFNKQEFEDTVKHLKEFGAKRVILTERFPEPDSLITISDYFGIANKYIHDVRLRPKND